MRILVTGQCTLHWGRLEYGNIGNYYIIEPFFWELRRVFPSAELVTTFQMSDRFCTDVGLSCLPMELYYAWNGADLETSRRELDIARIYCATGELVGTTSYIDQVLRSDLVVDFSGDIWGDNADSLGRDRFLIGLQKDRVAQLLGKPVAMLAGSPGPFTSSETIGFAREVFANFSLVTNRESISAIVLQEHGFDVSKLRNLACPAFLFETSERPKAEEILRNVDGLDLDRPIVGMILCGWNFSSGSFDTWPRPDEDYASFAGLVEHLIDNLGLQVCLLSHSNGFIPPPDEFQLIHGRDYKVIKQLQGIVAGMRGEDNLFALDGLYDTWTTKAIIGCFDMLVSGRIHGAVAGFSQGIPTVVIDYGQAPKAHKLRGFAELVGMGEYVADPTNLEDMVQRTEDCWINQLTIREDLRIAMPGVENLARKNFESLLELGDWGSNARV